MDRLTRLLTGTAGALAVCALVALGAGVAGAKSSGRPDSGTAYFSITHAVGNLQDAAGNNVDKVLGEGAVTYQIGLLPAASGTFTVSVKKVVLYTPTGALNGTATAKLTVGAKSETITNGKLMLTHGSGAQKGHSFVGTFTGTGNLTANTFVFHYKGTYK